MSVTDFALNPETERMFPDFGTVLLVTAIGNLLIRREAKLPHGGNDTTEGLLNSFATRVFEVVWIWDSEEVR